jgi:hypothetical protein
MANKNLQSVKGSKPIPDKRSRVETILDQLMEGMDPNSPTDETMRRMLENALDRAAKAESDLDAAKRRLEW